MAANNYVGLEQALEGLAHVLRALIRMMNTA